MPRLGLARSSALVILLLVIGGVVGAGTAAAQGTPVPEFKGPLPITAESSPSHDQGIDDGLAHGRNFRQRAPKFCGRNVEYLRLVRGDAGRTDDRGALEHGHVPDEIPFTRGGEVILRAIARLEGLEFTAQNNR